MRKVPVLTMVCLTAFVGLAYAGAPVANDPPDFMLAPGASTTIDLGDFFDSTDDISYSVDGAAITGSVADIFGSETDAELMVNLGATAAGESVSADSKVVVSSNLIGNGPAVDDNNRIPGVSGNIFYNGIVPGSSVDSVMNLVLPEVGAGGTAGGGTGAAALIATVATIDMSMADTGLIMSSRELSDTDTIVPTLNADGSYSIATTDAFAGTYIVTLGAGNVGVQVFAADAVAVDLSAGWVPELPSVVQGADLMITTAGADPVMVFTGAPIEVGAGVVTLSVDVMTNTDVANVALIGFEGAPGGGLAFTNPSGANLQAGVMKNMAISFVTQSGQVTPGVQVAGAAAEVTFSNMMIVKAGPASGYSMNPNAKNSALGDGANPSSIAWMPDATGAGTLGFNVVDVAASTDNNFAAAADDSILLAGTGDNTLSAAGNFVDITAGTTVAECYVKKVAGDAGMFALVLTDGPPANASTFVASSAIPSDGFAKVIAALTVAADSPRLFVAQAAGFDAIVDDISLRVADDNPAYFDADLLGN